MSIYNFPSTRFIRVLEIGDTVKMGSFQVVNKGQLKYVRVLFYLKGTLAGTERFRVKIYSDSLYTAALYTSSWTSLSDCSITIPWYGWIRATFARENMSNQLVYYIATEVDGYTKSGLTSFMSLVYDTHQPVYDNGQSNFKDHPLSFLVYQYEET